MAHRQRGEGDLLKNSFKIPACQGANLRDLFSVTNSLSEHGGFVVVIVASLFVLLGDG